ncbi:MAG TPA: HAD-IC family P-type ATPase [Nitriliruptorales bacterium]|nr:HAD-IC family P-type ATPase [Nitriliruptorales bacterium]
MVLGKTGTLARGQPEVVAVVAAPRVDEDDLLRPVAAVERESEHPLARAVVQAAEQRGLPPVRVQDFQAVPGHGLVAVVEGQRVAVGNARLVSREGVAIDGLAGTAAELSGQRRTLVQVAVDGRTAGLLAIADAPRTTAVAAVAALRQLGIRPVMLSGDNRATAERIAVHVGMTDVIAEVLPADKATKVAELQAAGWPWSATASTTATRRPRPTSVSPSGPGPTSRSRPRTWCSCAPIPSMWPQP